MAARKRDGSPGVSVATCSKEMLQRTRPLAVFIANPELAKRTGVLPLRPPSKP